MDTSAPVFYAGGLPALISTGDHLYVPPLKNWLLFVSCHIPQNRREGGNAHARLWSTRAQPRSGREKGNTEICKQVSGRFSEQYSGGTQLSPGSVSLPRRRKDLCLPSCGDAAEYSEEPVVQEDAKRLQGRRCRNTQDNYGKEPSDPYINSEGIPIKSSIRENASNEQPSDDAGTGRECDDE